MTRMLFALGIAMLFGCSGKEHAGGTTVETTNGIAGVVQVDGKPAPGIRIVVISDSYIPSQGAAQGRFVTKSDESGHFEFPLPPQGNYRIIARDSLTENTAMKETLVRDSLSYEVSLELKASGKIRLPLQNVALKVGDWLSLQGSDLARQVTVKDLQDSVFVLSGVPAGTYQGIYWTSSASAHFIVDQSIQVVTNEEEMIADSVLVPEILEVDLSGILMDSSAEGIHYPTLFGKPAAVVLEAKIHPQSGLVGGEVVSLGNNVGFRVDANDTMVSVYAYSSYNGPFAFTVLSGYYRRPDDTSAVHIAMLDDPANKRLELWFNGEFHSAVEPDSVHEIAYIKAGTETWIGRHAVDSTGNHFVGVIDWVRVQAIPASEWVYRE